MTDNFPGQEYSPEDKMNDTLIKNCIAPRCMWSQINFPQEVIDKYNEFAAKSEELGYKKLGIGNSEERGWFLVNVKDPVKERCLEIVWSEKEPEERI